MVHIIVYNEIKWMIIIKHGTGDNFLKTCKLQVTIKCFKSFFE